MTKTEIEELEVLDRMLLKRILSGPNSTPTTALFLETGCMSITTIIKARRVNYLQYLVKLPKEEMLSKFFHCQWLDNCQGRSDRISKTSTSLWILYLWKKKVRVQLENTGEEERKII